MSVEDPPYRRMQSAQWGSAPPLGEGWFVLEKTIETLMFYTDDQVCSDSSMCSDTRGILCYFANGYTN